MDKLKPTLEIIVRDKEVIFISYSGEFHHKTVLLLDEEVDETIAVEYRIKVGYNHCNLWTYQTTFHMSMVITSI